MGHTSLEAFSYPSSANALKESRFNFYFCNCFRLVGNEQSDGVEAILEFGLLHQDRNPWLQYNVVVPGSSSIPEWFIHQSAGYLVPVELPPHWYNTKLKGLAFCAVFNTNITMGSKTRVLTRVVLEVEAEVIQTGVVLEVGAVEGGIKVVAGTTETILVRIISPLNGTKSQTIMGKGGKVMMVLSVGAKEVAIRGQGIGILGLVELAIN
ncbi:hypothetical protein VitviT2T_018597 [Vitis vinifera]|uniref:C-JID domain-containing protein n=1 Tax=Vitis vinifera TaxID=29760 RepID=A0ABY9CYJ0_VITVI|nr:hypothetical protein VitviT2T_018597 [Vitis vinifera]